jgi:hypothetical protein
MPVTYTRNARFARGETATLGPWPLENTGISAADVTAGAIATIRISRVVGGTATTYLELNSGSTSQIAISSTEVTVELVPASTGALPVAAAYRCEVSVAVTGGEVRVIGDGVLTVRDQLPETDIPAPDPDDSLIRDFDALLLRDTDPAARPTPTGTTALITWHDGVLGVTDSTGTTVPVGATPNLAAVLAEGASAGNIEITSLGAPVADTSADTRGARNTAIAAAVSGLATQAYADNAASAAEDAANAYTDAAIADSGYSTTRVAKSWVCGWGINAASASTALRFPYAHYYFGSATSVESTCVIMAPASGTITSICWAHVGTPLTTNSVTYTLRINGVDTTASVTVTPANSTNPVVVSGLSVSVAAGDKLTFKSIQSGTEVGTNIQCRGSVEISTEVADTLIVPAGLTYDGGCVGWWDAFSSGTTTGGATIAPVNLISGSNAVIAAAPGSSAVTYVAIGTANQGYWNGRTASPAWNMANASLVATGSDIINAANGLGKTWLYLIGWVPKMGITDTQYACGWSKLAAASGTGACGITRTSSKRYTWGVFEGATETIDTTIFHQNAQILEVSRPNGNQLQVGVNNVRTPAISWGNGVTFDVDRFNIGGWAANNTANASGDAWVQFVQVFNKIPEDLQAIYAYNKAHYSGYELIGTI